MEENLLVQLLSEGLSWQDSLSAKEQAALLNSGKTTRWKEEVLASAGSLGIPKVLRQVAFSFRNVTAWGIYIDSILDLFGIPELQGLACDPSEFVERVAKKEPESWDAVKEIAISFAGEYLKDQIENGDVYLLHPSSLTSVEFSVFVPSIIEARKDKMDQSKPYLTDDGFVDMFDFLELPITMELMLESGVGGRSPLERAKVVLERISELGLLSNTEVTEKRKVKRSPEERYLALYQNCTANHRDLLRGAAMSYDPDEKICKKGIELIYASGHAHSLQPLLLGLDKNDEEIVNLSLKGLGILGNSDVIDNVAKILDYNAGLEVQATACLTLGKLGGHRYIDKIVTRVASSNDETNLAGMKALLLMNTPESLDRFWQYIQRFGMPKLANIAGDIADTKTDNAIIFMIGLLLLDLQAFIHTGEVHFYNAFLQVNDETQKKILLALVSMFREHAVTGFGRMGERSVPVLASLLKIFPETSHLFRDRSIWESSERQLEDIVSSRIGEYFRLPRAESIPAPVIQTIRALGVTHSVRAIPYLEEICKMDNEDYVSSAMEALSEIDLPAIDAILKVDTPSFKLQEQKIRDLGTIVHPKVTKWLIEQLDDKDPRIRMEAVTMLAMRNDPDLAKPLMKAAKDSHKGVRAGLANVIIRLGMNTYPEIMRLLSEDKDDAIRKVITKAQLVYKAAQDDDFWA
ncbi:hypothetical protein EU528_09030 [Candidatus Thorarchaeota archaeon]|nr:MAG: hypothetical protein EU528_09030 [Candidatus Thorarchaeota archaeon]